ncbi:TPA: hypothetical protein DCZ15_03195 [Candidatus Falkowbacteria bacterium]|nr:MAG: hypothetical protein UV95_C0002G0025 [Candidatus Falkowbacteria bacterium GW2011_GWF2_43_32]HBA36855.1 hypothetical protein [Candidatus Falkowbacteria bacterium]
MKTFAGIGRDALSHLFTKKKIFSFSVDEKQGIVRIYPRVITISKKPIDLGREYLAYMVGIANREKNHKIFLWDIELGLNEIQLTANENEGKLIDLIIRTQSITPTHVVIAEKEEWNDSPMFQWDVKLEFAKRGVELAQPCSVERITIYSLNDGQKQAIVQKK